MTAPLCAPSQPFPPPTFVATMPSESAPVGRPLPFQLPASLVRPPRAPRSVKLVQHPAYRSAPGEMRRLPGRTHRGWISLPVRQLG
jgi:hypothetical protein